MASAAAVASSRSDALATSIAGQIRHHRLEIEQRLEPALRNLGLIRRVRRVPARVLEHVPRDDGRRDRVVVAQADVAAADTVRCGELRAAGDDTRPRFPQRAGRAACVSADVARGRSPSISASSEGAPIDVEHRANIVWRGPRCRALKRIDHVGSLPTNGVISRQRGVGRRIEQASPSLPGASGECGSSRSRAAAR